MPKDVAASVHQRLLNKAREAGRPFDELLQYFAMERFLYRLSRSQYVDRFILKGALLFRVWMLPDSRATRDMDFLAFVDNSIESLSDIVRAVIRIDVPEDGLVFNPDSVEAERIKEDADYEGVRIRFNGLLGKARVRMQIDVGFGDVVHPAATENQYPTLLDHPAPVLRLYPPETVLAEKLEAMLHLGALNSRMKDFYDIWRLSQQSFDGGVLFEAVRKTLENRNTKAVQFAELEKELNEAGDKQTQWAAFLGKSMVTAPTEFAELLQKIGKLVSPVLGAIVNQTEFEGTWEVGAQWVSQKKR
jgi:predicted nucleotidyltransferase component of viral defense system